MNKKLLILLTLLISGSLFAQKTITLEEAIKIALQRNSNLIKTQNNLETSKARVKSAYGNLLPSLSTSANWSWTRTSDKGGKQTDFFGYETVTPASKVDTRNYSLSAGGNLVLFDGLANIASVKQSKADLKSAKLSLDKLKQDIILETTNLYYDVVYNNALLKVREDNVKYNNWFLETVEERNKLGSIPKADVYAQQVQAGNAELQFIQQKNIYENVKNNLLNYLALDVLQEYKFVEPKDVKLQFEDLDANFETISKMVNSALHKRLDYKSMKLQLESADNGITIAKGGLFPSLSSNFGLSTSALDPEKLFDRKIYNVGLNLRFPIFSNWNTELQIEIAKVQYKNTMEDLKVLERQIKIEVKQTYLDLLAAKKQVDVSNKNVVSALENRKINNERYKLGSGTILDVLQSDKDYQQALSDNLNAKFQYYKLKEKLLNSLGELKFENFE